MRSRPARQSGIVLVTGLGLLLALVLMTYVLFSTGQAVNTRMRLTHATDAAAYSAAVWQARVLNYSAYVNRAVVAHEVAIGQAATLVSYAQFLEQLLLNAERVSYFVPGAGQVISRVLAAANRAHPLLNSTLATATYETTVRSESIRMMLSSQEAMLRTATGFQLSSLTAEVARMHDRNFFAHVTAMPTTDTLRDFVRLQDGGLDRQRTRQLVMTALDRFSRGRNGSFLGVFQRRGATELVRLNDRTNTERWQAFDTLSTHVFGFELVPLGWGAAEVARQPVRALDPLRTLMPLTVGGGLRRPSEAQRANRRAYGYASKGIWTSPARYGGIAAIHDLNRQGTRYRLNPRFPTLALTVMGIQRGPNVRTAQNLRLAGGRAMPRDPQGNDARFLAVSSAEVYFRAPAGEPQMASLFSPYWQVRLKPVTDAEMANAMANRVARDLLP